MGRDMIEVVCSRPFITPTGPDRVRISATVTIAGVARELWFEVPEESVAHATTSDAFALASLLPALRVAERLVVEGPISPLLRRNLEELQGLFTAWFPEFHRVEIDAPTFETVSPATDTDTAAFFSGGVDSFYTAITRADDLDSLIYVDGLDMIDPTPEFRHMVRSHVEAAASELGKPLHRVETNLRDLLDSYARWGDQTHAVALSSIAHALGGSLGTALVGADRTYSDLFPWAAHPLVIHLTSSERVRIEPVGWTTPRVDRVRLIADSPVAMRHLRVCWENPDGAYNCGSCKKCLRTKTALAIAGSLERCETMDDHLDPHDIAGLEVGRTAVAYFIDSIPRAEASGLVELANAMRALVGRSRRRTLTDEIDSRFEELLLLGDDGGEFVTRHRDSLFTGLDAHHGRWLTRRVISSLPRKVGRKLRSTLSRDDREPPGTHVESEPSRWIPSTPVPPGVDGILLGAPGGNTGDQLIVAGCERFLEESGLEVWTSDGSIERAVEEGDDEYLAAALEGFAGLVFFPGGGNLGIYPENERLRRAVITTAKRARGFLVMPQSCFGVEHALRDDRVTVWAREVTSHDLLMRARVTTRLVPDASFAMSDAVPAAPGGSGGFFILRAPGVCEERVVHRLVADGPSEDLTFATPLDEVVSRLRPWGRVVSDRLHGAIISVMMGKRTGLLPVRYHKNRSFYETWLAPDPGIAFLDTQDDLNRFRDGGEPPTRDLAAMFLDRAEPAMRDFLDACARPRR